MQWVFLVSLTLSSSLGTGAISINICSQVKRQSGAEGFTLRSHVGSLSKKEGGKRLAVAQYTRVARVALIATGRSIIRLVICRVAGLVLKQRMNARRQNG